MNAHWPFLTPPADAIAGLDYLPEGVQVLALDTGLIPQTQTRTFWRIGAAVGQQILARKIPNVLRDTSGEPDLARVGSNIWRALRLQIPEALSGAQVLATLDSSPPHIEIEPERDYLVRLPTEHPIYEGDRARRLYALMRAAIENPEARHELLIASGELLVQSHFSLAHRCGIVSPRADFIVQRARTAGTKSGIYGARLVGEESGGLVVLLLDAGEAARNALQAIAADFHAST